MPSSICRSAARDMTGQDLAGGRAFVVLEQSAIARTNRRSTPMRVLIVEDNEELVALLKKGLAQGGLPADSVGTAGDAAHVLATMQYSVVVLDLGLPDDDGLGLLRDLRRRGDSIPVLVLTARDGVSDRVTGLRAGADDYLAKPFAMEE